MVAIILLTRLPGLFYIDLAAFAGEVVVAAGRVDALEKGRYQYWEGGFWAGM